MKILFPLPKDDQRHRYCQNCYSEKVKDIIVKGKRLYYCSACRQTHDRLIDLNPDRVWWVDSKSKEYWHESVGVIVSRPDKKILLFNLTKYPYGYTIPAGHLDKGKSPEKMASIELLEETGIKSSKLTLLSEENLKESCRGGADYHRWHLFTFQLTKKIRLSIDPGEGTNPIWLTAKDALTKDLTFPTKHFLKNSLFLTKSVEIPERPQEFPSS